MRNIVQNYCAILPNHTDLGLTKSLSDNNAPWLSIHVQHRCCKLPAALSCLEVRALYHYNWIQGNLDHCLSAVTQGKRTGFWVPGMPNYIKVEIVQVNIWYQLALQHYFFLLTWTWQNISKGIHERNDWGLGLVPMSSKDIKWTTWKIVWLLVVLLGSKYVQLTFSWSDMTTVICEWNMTSILWAAHPIVHL